jgi:serine/threonine-protein phosphatase 2A regulatory subunit A
MLALQELLPFLADGIDDDDEVLVAIAKSLGNFVDHVGGPKYAETLLPTLELLLTVGELLSRVLQILGRILTCIPHTRQSLICVVLSEESTVREAASASTKVIAASLPKAVIQGQYATMVANLATKEWFTARISAATLIASLYPHLTSIQQEEHLKYYDTLCRDDTPMVRRVAAQNLGAMLDAVVTTSGRSTLAENGVVSTVLIPLYETLASNEQPDSVRLQTTENCVTFGKVLSKFSPDYTGAEIGLVKRLLPLILATIDDRSWRVRWTAASKFADVIAGFDKLPGVMDSLVPAYEKLLQDPEAEVSYPLRWMFERRSSTAHISLSCC